MTTPEAVKDKEFWHILTMVTLSISYGFFTKVAFKSYGSTNINDDIYLTRVALYGFITAATSRFIWPFLQGIIGFKKVYAAILFI
jgi:thiamine transporter ThiT